MATTHSLDDLKHYHYEATQFFASELMLLKEAIPKIQDDRLAKAATLLISGGQTGAALLQLATQVDTFTGESIMLARSFIEKVINFCYVGICDDKEYRAFIIHPAYKYYHRIVKPSFEEDPSLFKENYEAKLKKQEKLKEIPIVQEALAMFSDTKPYLNWTNKSLNDRISAIEDWGKLLDVFLMVSKLEYYSDASEALHGSLYGCTFDVGVFDPEFRHEIEGEIDKKLYKDNTCVLLHLGMLVHECFTLISYSNDIQEIWDYSYKNRNLALSLWFHVLGKNKLQGN